MYDVIIIGGGPAGMTAGIYTTRGGLKTLILEKESIGGQLSETPLIENYPGYESISGNDLSDIFYKQVTKLGAEYKFGRVKKIEDGEVKKVILDNDKVYETKAVILATGSYNNKLKLDNEEELIGKGIHFCVSCDAPFYKGKTVAVIGGANSAVVSALFLADIAKKVYLIYRGEKLRGEKTFNDRLFGKENVEVLYETTVTKLNGKEKLESIEIDTYGEKKDLLVDGIFESVGMHAQTDLVRDLIDLDEQDYVKSIDCKTSLPWLFVAGDCRQKPLRQVTTATADGTNAATYVIKFLR